MELACAAPTLTRKDLPVRFDHLLGVLTGGLGQPGAAQHARNFFGALFADDGADMGAGMPLRLVFLDHVVMVGKGCDLWQVRNAEDLSGAGQSFEFFADGLGGAASNAGVDFVEDHGALHRVR